MSVFINKLIFHLGNWLRGTLKPMRGIENTTRVSCNERLKRVQVCKFRWDLVNNELHFDEGLITILGFHVAELELAKRETWIKLIHPDDTAILLKKLWRCTHKGGSPFFHCKVRLIAKDGNLAPISAQGMMNVEKTLLTGSFILLTPELSY